MKTVFIALMRDFVAMKTVVITDYHGPHGNDDRLQGEKLRNSWQKALSVAGKTGTDDYS